jgi:class 3 adenylate cyclase
VQVLAAACDHVRRLLTAESVDLAVEFVAELILAVAGAKGVQVFAQAGEELSERWSAGQLEAEEAERQAMAAAALKQTRTVTGEQVSAIPLVSGSFSGVVVAEGGGSVETDLTDLLATLGSEAIRAVEQRSLADRQRELRVRIGRYVSPPLAVASSRSDHSDLAKPADRSVSVLCLSIGGLAAQVELIGPQRLLPVLNDYFQVLVDSVYENEGVLLEVGLGGAVAVFGAPIRADDATQADLAAASGLRALDGLLAMVEDWGLDGLPIHMEARAGVATGQAFVGAFGPPERPIFAAVGAQVALARKLATHGSVGEMVVDSTTRSLLADRLSTRSLGAVEVSGLDYPVFAYGARRGR